MATLAIAGDAVRIFGLHDDTCAVSVIAKGDGGLVLTIRQDVPQTQPPRAVCRSLGIEAPDVPRLVRALTAIAG